ncbi:MAG: RNase adapter RapZ [Defluviitaleaceae bacterium]|nr:RNase adapter RapZ [Defluviitaleaceae bacterium]
MRIVIVTGMSGAGKTTALKIFEDAGFHCVDNLPPAFIVQFVKFCMEKDTGITQVALGIDIRGGKMFHDFADSVAELKEAGIDYSILFLDSSNDILLNRYKETRHLHPLAKNDLVSVGIAKERALVEDVKEQATHIIDTSHILPRNLKEKILNLFTNQTNTSRLMINIMSFGFKYGMPKECDMMFDVRFLPNPYYDPELKPYSGLDAKVSNYVLGHDVTVRFLDSLLAMLHFLIPHYISEGKSQLNIGIGCTGGRHRSVAITEELKRSLSLQEYAVVAHHQDIEKDQGKK